MKRIIVEVSKNTEVEKVQSALNKFDFIKSVKTEDSRILTKKEKLKKAIVFARKKDGLKDLKGVWKNSDKITLESIREKVWNRNW